MSNNYDEYENDSRVDSNRSLLRKFIVILLIVIVIVIIFLLLRGCDGNIINRKGKDNDNNGKSVVLSGYEKALVDAKKMSKQLEEIIETDDEMILELEKMDYLEEIEQKNKKLIEELSN